MPADKSASNDTWEQAPTAFAALLAMAALPITFIICIIWESKGRDFFWWREWKRRLRWDDGRDHYIGTILNIRPVAR